MNTDEDRARAQRRAVAHLYHTLFTGLILTVVTRRSATDAAAWVEALFRKQHHAKFLSSFEKLGLGDMPPAVAAAAYHYHSNRIGGVDVEFMRAVEAGDADKQAEIAAKKQALRDATSDPAITAATTPDELKAVVPSALVD